MGQELGSQRQRPFCFWNWLAAASPAVVNVSIGGLWRTTVEVTADTTWLQLKQLIHIKAAVPELYQHLTPSGDYSKACGLGDGDEVMCEWGDMQSGRHPLHLAGEQVE